MTEQEFFATWRPRFRAAVHADPAPLPEILTALGGLSRSGLYRRFSGESAVPAWEFIRACDRYPELPRSPTDLTATRYSLREPEGAGEPFAPERYLRNLTQLAAGFARASVGGEPPGSGA